jgi:hypothetical protein
MPLPTNPWLDSDSPGIERTIGQYPVEGVPGSARTFQPLDGSCVVQGGLQLAKVPLGVPEQPLVALGTQGVVVAVMTEFERGWQPLHDLSIPPNGRQMAGIGQFLGR